MTTVVAILCLATGILGLGQIVSVANLGLAQRLGLQEKPEHTDPLFTRLEVWTARWDLVVLWTLPVAGILILADHSWWPFVAMIGGGVFVDTGGREWAKYLGLRQEGVRTGSPSEQRALVIAYVAMIVVGALAIVAGLVEAT